MTERVEVYPPKSLYPTCTTPDHTITTNGDLARGYADLRNTLRLCREDVEALRKWGEGNE